MTKHSYAFATPATCATIFAAVCATEWGQFATVAYADEIRSGRSYSEDLARPVGQTFLLSGGGAGGVDDYSAAISNPAGLALRKEFSGTGSLTWRGENIRSGQAATHDSTLAEVAAGFNYMQTTAVTGGKDRKFTLGLAERLGESAFSVGLAADYSQLEASKLPGFEDSKKVDVIRARFGALYAFSDTIQIGASTDGYFDKMRDKRHQVGVSVGAAKYYLFYGDAVFRNSAMFRTIGGFTISVKEYFDMTGSYGFQTAYELEPSMHFFAAGFSVKSQQMKLSYGISRTNIKDMTLNHQVSASIVLSL